MNPARPVGVDLLGQRRVTVQDIATAAGVSRATVSYVLNAYERISISDQTRARVRQVARELGYQPNPLARGLRGKPTFVVGHVVGAIDPNMVGVEVARATQQWLASRGYRMLIADAQGQVDQEEAAVRLLLDHGVDAILFNGPLAPDSVRTAQRAGVPSALLVRYPAVPGVVAVTADERLGAVSVADHLRAFGHRRIAYCGLAGGKHPQDAERLQAMLAATTERGMAPPELWIGRMADQREEAVEAWATALLAGRPRPTAIYAGGNLFALGVLRAAHRLGLRIPDELSLISWDDQFADLTHPRLTTISPTIPQIAERALSLLFSGPKGRPRATAAREERLPPVLRVRESTGPVPPSGGD